MGQKVSPIGFRTGVTVGWKSRWFAPKATFGEFLVEDEKVRRFVAGGVPFDAVGVGSSLYRTRIDFTADIVMLDGKPCSKLGRSLKPNPRIERVN